MASSQDQASREATSGGKIEDIASQIDRLHPAVKDLIRHKAEQDAVNEHATNNIKDLRAELAA